MERAGERAPLKPLRHESYPQGPEEEDGPSPSGEELRSPGPLPGGAGGSRPPAGCLACDDRGRTTALVNLSSIMERVDEQLLPALYRFVGAAFGARPSQLGKLTLSRALVQALASPLAGLLGHWYNRVWVLAAGAALWGTMTGAFAFTNSIWQAMPFWAMNGVGLALLIPTAQSLTADYNPADRRGSAFGLLWMTGALGALLGAVFATNVGHLRPLALEGWRFAFLAVAVASWVIAGLTLALGVDPRYTSDERYRVPGCREAEPGASWRSTAAEIGRIVTIPTFLVIILQGIVGSVPGQALVFLTLYFQLMGMSDGAASLLLAVFLASIAAGGLLGGYAGDAAAKRWPDHGRIGVVQFSVAVGVPLSVVIFKALPMLAGPGSVALYALVLSCMGLLHTWAAPACNNPIMSEIVPAHLRNLVFSFDRSFEMAIAACAAPVVGWLSEAAFGFKGNAETSEDPAENLDRARALGDALLVFTVAPWTLCALFYTGLHLTYPRDRKRAPEVLSAVSLVVGDVELTGVAGDGVEERQRLTAANGSEL